MRVADGIERIHENVINVYLVEEAGKLTVVDTGFPGNWPLLVAGLAGIGHTLADVQAILITHAHVDHVGMAERLRRASGAPVRVHGDDLEYLLAGKSPPGGGGGGFGLGLVAMLAYALRKRGFRMPPCWRRPRSLTATAWTCRAGHGWSTCRATRRDRRPSCSRIGAHSAQATRWSR